MTKFTDDQTKALAAKLDPANVRRNPRGYDYIEGWHAIAQANRIFGFDGWNREMIELREVRSPEIVNGNNRVGFIARVRITVGDIVRDGTGYGSGIAKDLGDAYESATKEAETDAMKRALMTFGNPFGLALYDKDKSEVGAPPPPEPTESEKRIADQLVKSLATVTDLTAWKSDPGNVEMFKDIPPSLQAHVQKAATERLRAISQPITAAG